LPRISEDKDKIISLMGNFVDAKTLKELSNQDESIIDSNENEQREKLKQRLLDKIDFANKTYNISDGSISPHLRSMYSRQAHLVSPADFTRRVLQTSEYSSNKSVGQYSSNNVQGHRRFIAQGLEITSSKHDNSNTDQEQSAVSRTPDEYLDKTKSPAVRYRELRMVVNSFCFIAINIIKSGY
jgi:hypothetical protein